MARPRRSRWRLAFRTVQLGMILAVLVTTFAAAGVSVFTYARIGVQDLSEDVLREASGRIDLRVREAVDGVVAQGAIAERLIASGRVTPDDATTQLQFFLPVLRAHKRLTYVSFGTERGEYWHVERRYTGAIRVQELRFDGDVRKRRDWELGPGGARTLLGEVVDPPFDPRKRPYYAAALAAGGPVWTESYVFADIEADRDVTGVTRAIPVRVGDALAGVLTIDFDLVALSDYLSAVPVGRTGFAFLLEERADGRRLIAHPNPEMLSAPGDAQLVEAIPAAESADPIVRAFAGAIPARLPTALVPIRLRVDGRAYFGAYMPVAGDDPPPWVLCAVLPVSDVMGRVEQMTRTMAFAASLGVLVAVLLGLLVARALSATVDELEHEMVGISRLELSDRVLLDRRSGIRELDDMRAATDAMKAGLRSFGRYVPTELVRRLIRAGGEARLGATRREITVLLVDIAGFTTLVEKNPPEVVLAALGEYLTEMNLAILATNGTVCQYLGDAVQAFWGAPSRQEDHAVRACRAALDMRTRTMRLAEISAAKGLPPLDTRFGLCSGPALVGNIGAPERFNYGCVGLPVSLAAYLEGLNKVYGTRLLISDATARAVKGTFVTRPVDWVLPPGAEDLVLVHELVGETVSPEVAVALDHYGTGLKAMHAGRFDEARAALQRAAAALPGDGPCRVMLEFLDQRAG